MKTSAVRAVFGDEVAVSGCSFHYGQTLMKRLNPFTADPVKALTLPYWSNPPFLISDIRVLWRSGLSAREPECQKFKMVG